MAHSDRFPFQAVRGLREETKFLPILIVLKKGDSLRISLGTLFACAQESLQLSLYFPVVLQAKSLKRRIGYPQKCLKQKIGTPEAAMKGLMVPGGSSRRTDSEDF